MPSRPGHGDAASSRVTPTLPRTSAALPGGPSLRDGPCKAESEGIPLPYSTPRHLLQYVTWRAKANGIMKLRRFAKRLRYRCGLCFAHLNHPFPTREGRERSHVLRASYTLNTFITSSPRWLMILTAMRPVEGTGNGREMSLCIDSHASASISALSVSRSAW